jgi:hypothetical protein
MTVDDLEQEANNASANLWAKGFFKKRELKKERHALRDRFSKVGLTLPIKSPTKSDWGNRYAELVREEAAQKFVDRMLNPPSPSGTTSLGADLDDAANHWITGVRAHDKWSGSPLFRDKVRGHGQVAGSTDGRLLRKLIKAATQKAATIDPNFDTYRNDIITARNRLNNAERALQNNPGDAQLQRNHTYAKQELSNQTQRLNEEVASKLDNILRQTGGSLALRKAIFLTQEKLRDPLGYKQKYSRVVPFDEPNDLANPNKWVKASRRFYTPASSPLPLPARSNGRNRNDGVVTMQSPPNNLPFFGLDTKKELIEDVGQKKLGECWLQASAASLPRSTLGNMFSLGPSYGSEGVTTRLHDKNGKPIYIRTQNNELWNNASDHKALWPAALTAAVAKVGRDDLRQFRENRGISTRDQTSGMPMYSVRDVYGKTPKEAAKLLTGKNPMLSISVRSLNPDIKQSAIDSIIRAAHSSGIERGVAGFRNFKSLHGKDNGSGHSVTFLGNTNTPYIGNFGNTWSNGGLTTNVAMGNKIFESPLSRMSSISFLDPRGANPANDNFISAPPSTSLTQAEYQEQRRGRLGNLFTRPR